MEPITITFEVPEALATKDPIGLFARANGWTPTIMDEETEEQVPNIPVYEYGQAKVIEYILKVTKKQYVKEEAALADNDFKNLLT